MCSLPVYEKVPTYDADVESRLALHSGATGSSDAKRVIFTYNPIWPRPGSLQHVSGLLGPNEDLTLQNIYAYFPSLANIPSERISFRLPVLDDATLAATILASINVNGAPNANPNGNVMMVGAHPVRGGGARSAPNGMALMAFEQWADVSPEAWTSFENDPPRRMAVIVADAPGEGLKRTLRTVSFILALILGPIALLMGFLGLMVYMDV